MQTTWTHQRSSADTVCFAAHGPFGILNVLRQDMLAHVLLVSWSSSVLLCVKAHICVAYGYTTGKWGMRTSLCAERFSADSFQRRGSAMENVSTGGTQSPKPSCRCTATNLSKAEQRKLLQRICADSSASNRSCAVSIVSARLRRCAPELLPIPLLIAH